jgi:DNA polymerase-3 subunit beta
VALPRTTALRRDLAAAPVRTVRREPDGVRYDVTTLALADGGTLRFAADDAGVGRIGVNREFLLQALEAADAGELVLDLTGPYTPLVIRNPDREDTVSLLMPCPPRGDDGAGHGADVQAVHSAAGRVPVSRCG